jgi:hypothetical protein
LCQFKGVKNRCRAFLGPSALLAMLRALKY